MHRFSIFTGGWFYHDLQLLFLCYTAWFARLCPEQSAIDALEVLIHHRMLPECHLKLIRSLAPEGPKEQLRAIAELAHEDILEGMDEEGITEEEGIEEPFE